MKSQTGCRQALEEHGSNGAMAVGEALSEPRAARRARIRAALAASEAVKADAMVWYASRRKRQARTARLARASSARAPYEAQYVTDLGVVDNLLAILGPAQANYGGTNFP